MSGNASDGNTTNATRPNDEHSLVVGNVLHSLRWLESLPKYYCTPVGRPRNHRRIETPTFPRKPSTRRVARVDATSARGANMPSTRRRAHQSPRHFTGTPLHSGEGERVSAGDEELVAEAGSEGEDEEEEEEEGPLGMRISPSPATQNLPSSPVLCR